MLSVVHQFVFATELVEEEASYSTREEAEAAHSAMAVEWATEPGYCGSVLVLPRQPRRDWGYLVQRLCC